MLIAEPLGSNAEPGRAAIHPCPMKPCLCTAAPGAMTVWEVDRQRGLEENPGPGLLAGCTQQQPMPLLVGELPLVPSDPVNDD